MNSEQFCVLMIRREHVRQSDIRVTRINVYVVIKSTCLHAELLEEEALAYSCENSLNTVILHGQICFMMCIFEQVFSDQI